ncbi:C40 family peptidase [Intestinimonas butyriciproducens]|uniref:C40 family peptidase n=1 Tax=Intestinimonas butyriciproducens TaxID=1297617 RepID=UPI00242B76BF|nr:C40 family peptidase [Intestinimonas butyriciproducens]
MRPEREGRGPRQDKAAPALRSDAKDKAEAEPKRVGPSWKKTARRIMAEAQPETAAPAAMEPESVLNVPGDSSEVPRPSDVVSPPAAAPAPDRSGVSGEDGPKYRRQSKREAASGQSVPKRQPLRQESRTDSPADKLHHDDGGGAGGRSGGDEAGSAPEPEPLRKSRLRMEKRETKLNKSREKLASQKPYKPPGPVRWAAGLAGRSVHGYVHGKIYQAEQENVGVEGAHRSELAGEAVGRTVVRFTKQRIRSHPAQAVHRAESRYTKAAANYQFQRAAQEHPELRKNALDRLWRKHRQRRQFQKQAKAAKQGAEAAKRTATATGRAGRAAAGFVRRHPVGVVIALLCLLLLVGLQSCVSSLTALGNGMGGSVAAATYPADDPALLGAEAAYAALEADLQNYLDTYENTHDYDEYHFDLDSIEHDPYVLLSILSALHEEGWTLADVESDLQALFDRQYILTERVVVETRQDSEGDSYSWSICYVTLTNENLSHLPVYIMDEGQMSRYALYMASLGNRPDLFPSSGYVDKYTRPGDRYEVPSEALADETFAAMLEVAERFVGYPYVWGGSSPATSFDCSGYLSYILNQCGWDVGRLGATGLYNYCTPISDPKPGDLVFFVGTYDTPGVSHCGLYLGNGMMLHAGDPIGYANLNTNYWQSHLYAYGRLP